MPSTISCEGARKATKNHLYLARTAHTLAATRARLPRKILAPWRYVRIHLSHGCWAEQIAERPWQRRAIRVFFAELHCPLQRGTNEKANRLLLQYLPKATDLSDYTQRAFYAMAHRLNTRRRKCLNSATPLKMFTQLRHQSPVELEA